ncbi:hypothetical protein [Streptomyces tsukubensis]|uniref:VG15 protein n=1 Tax=Streptomyces tsukubensis TaxID=83656 RepID=UPI003F4E4A96
MTQAQLDALSRQYQRDQSSLVQQVIASLVRWWAGVDVSQLRNPGRIFKAYQSELIKSRRRSIQLARGYHDDSRKAAIGAGSLPASAWGIVRPETQEISDAFFTTVAPIRGRLDDPEFLADLDNSLSPLVQNADRLTLDAGRSALSHAREVDPEVIGYYRKTDADPCGFCAMLASRGLVYTETRNSAKRTRSWVDEQNPEQYHPGCRCQTLPLFRGVSMPADDRRRADEYARMWKETEGSGSTQLKNFRDAIDSQRRGRNA